MYIYIYKCKYTYVNIFLMQICKHSFEQRIGALKSDEDTLSTVPHLSLLELEGRLKALNGCGTYTHVAHTTDCTHIWSRLPSLVHDSWAKTS